MMAEVDERDNQANSDKGESIHTDGGTYIRGDVSNEGGANIFGCY